MSTLRDAIWPDGLGPSRRLRCRHCGRRNDVAVAQAVFQGDRCVCGACDKPLFLGRDEPLTGLKAATYQHALDRRSLESLQALPGADAVVKWFMKQATDRYFRIQLMSSSVRCGPDQFPQARALFDTARRRLGLDFDATLYVSQSPVVNAYTSGAKDRLVVVHSSMFDLLTDDELIAVLGHELGHLHAQHPLYQLLARVVMAGASVGFGLGRLVTLPLQLGLLKWVRCAELTCDRAGLLASRDLEVSMRLLLKLCGGGSGTGSARFDLGAFMRQARELEAMETDDAIDGLFAGVMALNATHPVPVWRLMHLVHWVERGNYLELLAGDTSGVQPVA